MPEPIAVIVPVLNEAAALEIFLADLLKRQGDFRVVVVDGGSSDGTLEIARRFPGVAQVRSGKGRGLQMNAGARAAAADVLLFLHADTRGSTPTGGRSRFRPHAGQLAPVYQSGQNVSRYTAPTSSGS